MRNRHTEILLHLHVAALLLGGTALFSKLISMPAIDIIAYRTLICGVLLFSVAKAIKHKLTMKSLKHWLLLLTCSALFAVHWTAYFHAMKISTVAIGIVSMFTFPVITVFLEPLINHTRILKFDVLMGLLVFAGVVLIVPSFDLNNQTTAGVAFGLISAFAVAIRNILVGKHLSEYSPLTLMAFHAIVSFIILIPLTEVSVQQIGINDWLLLLALGTLFTAVPHTQKTYGLQHESAKKVSMIVSLQVVYASIFAYLLLDELVELNTILGGACILFAALAESVRPADPRSPKA